MRVAVEPVVGADGVARCARYLLGLKDHLRYHEYLAAGFPIATGVIEGACRYVVKDRTGRYERELARRLTVKIANT